MTTCDYCGAVGHTWQIHPEAHADVAAWEREQRAELAPFGDYREQADV
jgi:hypothetical protein